MPHHASHGSHDLFLVALSVLVAIIASYVALDFAAQARAPSRRSRHAWTAAALAMGAASGACTLSGCWASGRRPAI